MSIEEFRHNVDLYSADLSRWPQDLVRPALARMESCVDSKTYFEAALALDALLREGAAPEARPDLAALEGRIMMAVKNPAVAMPPPALFAFTARRAFLGLFVAAVLGFMAGFGHKAQASDTLLDAAFYTQDQIIAGDDALYNAEEMY